MDSRKLSFIQAVAGPDGARALAKAASRAPDLEWAIFPRVVMAWLEAVSQFGFEGPLPGASETHLSLAKAEGAFSGRIDVGDGVYAFEEANLYHVAGSVAVALGSDGEVVPELRSPKLSSLGRSIDLLVKSRTLRRVKLDLEQAKAEPSPHHGGASGAAGPGQAAAPQGPIPPAAATPAQPKLQGKGVGTKSSAGPAGALPKLPGASLTPPKRPAMKVSKAEAAHVCSACGDPQFAGGRYVSCLCFRDLAKSCRTTVTPDGYVLEFGPAWDDEAVMALAENLGKHRGTAI